MGKSKKRKEKQTTRIEHTSREEMNKQLLVALNDKTNIAIVVDREGLQLLILALGTLTLGKQEKERDEMRWELFADLRRLQDHLLKSSPKTCPTRKQTNQKPEHRQ